MKTVKLIGTNLHLLKVTNTTDNTTTLEKVEDFLTYLLEPKNLPITSKFFTQVSKPFKYFGTRVTWPYLGNSLLCLHLTIYCFKTQKARYLILLTYHPQL